MARYIHGETDAKETNRLEKQARFLTRWILDGVEAGPVGELLLSADDRARLCPGASPDEALLVCEDGETLHVGLFLDESVLAQLVRGQGEPWSLERLRGFCHAAEGVSHFLYLAHRAEQHRPVSLLELEAQAEVDKYLCVLLQLWAVGRRAASPSRLSFNTSGARTSS